MSRRVSGLCVAFFVASFLLAAPSRAQDAGETIAQAEALYGPPPPMEDCSDEQEAAILSGEIVVCRRKSDQERYRVSTENEAETRYAEATMNRGNPPTPDVAGAGIFSGPPTVSGLCLIPPCPPPPAYLIDFDALPETPAGSDAERVGQGLAPLSSVGEENRAPN